MKPEYRVDPEWPHDPQYRNGPADTWKSAIALSAPEPTEFDMQRVIVGYDPAADDPPAGKKFDDGKPPVYQGFTQYFPRAIEAVANVSAFGAKKYNVPYNDQNWSRVESDKFEDSLQRHTDAIARGEDHAEDSGLLHLAHRAWNAMATLELALRERNRRGVKETKT
jgi:hypothetical protein